MAKTPKRKEETPDVEAFLNSLLGGAVATEPTARAVTPRLTKATRDLPGQQYDKMKKAVKAGPGADVLRQMLLAEKGGLPEIHQMSDEEVQGMPDEEIEQMAPDWVGTERPEAIPAELEALLAEAMGGAGGQPTDMISQVLSAIQGDGLPVTPVMKATKAGPMQKPHPDNFSPPNQMQKLLEMIIGGGGAAPTAAEEPYWDPDYKGQ